MAATEEQIRAALARVIDPELRKDLVELEMVRGIAIDGGDVTVGVALTIPGCPLKATIDNPKAKAILEEFAAQIGKTTPRGVTSYQETESHTAFINGDAAFMRNWPYAWAELQKPGSAVAGRVGVVSLGDGTQGSWGFSMLRGSRWRPCLWWTPCWDRMRFTPPRLSKKPCRSRALC